MNSKWKRLKAERYGTLKEMFYHSIKAYADNIAYYQIIDKDSDVTITYKEFGKNVIGLGTQLINLGLKGKKIAIIGENSIPWMTSYFAITCGCGVAVPLDKELDKKTLAYQIDFSDAEAVIYSGKFGQKISRLMENCPKVKYWIIMRPEFAFEIPEHALYFDKLVSSGKNLSPEEFFDAEVDPEDLCDIIFTSGTTGANKGVMLSHNNVCSAVYSSLCMIDTGELGLACLPINHSYEKNSNVLCAFSKGVAECINDDLMHLVQNIKRYDLSIGIMVPVILETIERRIKAEVKKAGLERHTLFGITVSNMLRKIKIDRREEFFKPILANFGPTLRQIVVGGAPLKEETRWFFDSIGITIVNGYGISECAPLVAANLSWYQRPGSVGFVVPTCEVKIENPNKNGDGVIYVKGSSVMMGYYKDPESTARVMHGEWFDTGDIGHLDSSGCLYISGRLKNFIILSNGKNVCPEEIEEMLSEAMPYVKEVVVYTDDKGLGIYASMYLDPDYVKANKIEDQYEFAMKGIREFNKTAPSFKRISNINIVDTEFEKTTTQKIQRFKVEKVTSKQKTAALKGEKA